MSTELSVGDPYKFTKAETKTYTKVKVEHDLTNSRVYDILISAFEGGINYWCDKLDAGDLGHVRAAKAFALGLLDKIRLHDEEEDKWVVLTQQSFSTALHVVAEKHPYVLRRVIDEQDDAADADVIVQVSVFGDTVYG